MSRTRVCILIGLFLGTTIRGVCLYIKFTEFVPNFWPVFVCPAFALLALQWMALAPWKLKRRRLKRIVFTVTDYLYYVLVTVVVSVIAYYLVNGDLIARFQNEREKQDLETERSKLEASLTGAREKWTEYAKQSFDPAVAGRCLGANVAARSRTNARDPLNEMCPAILEKLFLPGQIQAMETRLGDIKSKLDRPSTTKQPTSDRQELKYVWIPTVVLLGVTPKLVKTTASLLELLEARAA